MGTQPLYHKKTIRRGDNVDSEAGGRKLKQYRLSQRLTQEELAEKAGVDRLVIVRLEKGITASPTLEGAILVGRALGLDPYDVVRIYEI